MTRVELNWLDAAGDGRMTNQVEMEALCRCAAAEIRALRQAVEEALGALEPPHAGYAPAPARAIDILRAVADVPKATKAIP